MRYIIEFADGTSKRIDEDEAKAVMMALSEKKGFVVRGGFFLPHFVRCVKPISGEWFGRDLPSERKLLDDKASNL